jgi:hypothetical protein
MKDGAPVLPEKVGRALPMNRTTSSSCPGREELKAVPDFLASNVYRVCGPSGAERS